MSEITQKEIDDLKRIYKEDYGQELTDEKASVIIDGANKYAEILYELIITNIQQKKNE